MAGPGCNLVDVASKEYADGARDLLKFAKAVRTKYGGKISDEAMQEIFSRAGARYQQESRALGQIKRQIVSVVAKEAQTNRPLWQKVGMGVVDAANAGRSLTTSFDLSAPGRQGFMLVVANPVMAAKSFGPMIRAMADENYALTVDEAIKTRSNFTNGLYDDAGLHISPITHDGDFSLAALSKHEEAYLSNLAEKIPVLGRGVRGSERAYITFLNKLRVDNFDTLVKHTEKWTGEKITEKDAKMIATFVNDATGRGDLGAVGNSASVLLNSTFFSPRFVASRFRIAGGAAMFKPGSMPARMAIARTYLQFASGMAVIYGLSQLAGAKVETDPRSSMFGKLQFGKVVIDPTAGFSQLATYIAREAPDFMGGGKTKTQAGNVVPLNGKGFNGTRGEVSARFIRSKLSPIAGTIVDYQQGTNYIGEPVTTLGTKDKSYLNGEIAKNLVPMSIPDIVEAGKKEGIPASATVGAFNFWGIGTNYQEPKKPNMHSGLGSLGSIGGLGSLGKL